jgi:NADPH:quinone reductase-like Zn-dependent oxidoreductase
MIEEPATIAESEQVETGMMKAIVRERFGSPDVLQLKEVAKPVPDDVRGVLVKVYASSVNPADRYDVNGMSFALRLVLPLFRMGVGVRRPKEPQVGTDIAGTVEAVHSNVTQFKPGDEVYGVGFHGYAEYAVSRENGAEVTAVTNTQNLDLIRSLGADHVIDYTKEDFTKNGERYDLICDIASIHSPSTYKRIMNLNGIGVIVGFRDKVIRRLIYFVIQRRFSRGDKKFRFFVAKSNQEDLVTLKDLMESGKIVPVIDRRYELGEAAEAMKYLVDGHTRGKIVITIDHNDSSVSSGTEKWR